MYAENATYFDPTTDKRVDGLAALRVRLAGIRQMKAPFKDLRYEMVAPRVQRLGDAAILTFNLVNYATMGDQHDRVLNRWNCTEVYARVSGRWKIVHSHWSYTRPEIRQPVTTP
jgi:ketosteroid isomerase-like protein